VYNLVPEAIESGTGKNRVIYNNRPGLVSFSTLGGGSAAVRFLYALNGALYAICGTSFYTVASNGEETSRGTVSASGTAQMVGNGAQVLMIANGAMHCYTISGSAFANISPGFVPSSLSILDLYYVASEASAKTIWISGILDGTSWDALDFASKEGFPDDLVGVFADHRQLWLFGRETTEAWYDSGNSDFPFERSPGGFIEQGCASIHTVKKLDNSIFWLGQDSRGAGIVWKADGFTPMRVSTHAIEYHLAQSSDLSAAMAYSYQLEGHFFYALYVPDLDSTFVYDAATRIWHEETYYDSGHTPHLGRCHAYCFDKHLVGSRAADGLIYSLDNDAYLDVADPIRFERIAPHLHSGRDWIFYDRFRLDIEAGVGLDVAAEDPGYNPTMYLCYSEDSARSWSTPIGLSMGTYQSYEQHLEWVALGRSRDRVFRLYNDEPVKQAWLDAHLELQRGIG